MLSPEALKLCLLYSSKRDDMGDTLLLSISFLVLLGFTLAFAHFSLPRYKFIKLIVFLLFLFVQILPVPIFAVTEHAEPERNEFTQTAYEECRNMYQRYKLDHDTCTDIAERKAKEEYESIRLGILFMLSVFILTPISGLSMKLSYSISNQLEAIKNQQRLTWNVVNLSAKVITICILIFIGTIIVWGYCLPPAHINSTVKTLSLVIGLPFLFSVGVMTEAFGRSFAYSGKHAAQDALASYMEDENG